MGGDPSALSMSVSSPFYEKLVKFYGRHSVVNVFKETGMEEWALQLGIGGWVVREAFEPEKAASWHGALVASLSRIAADLGPVLST